MSRIAEHLAGVSAKSCLLMAVLFHDDRHMSNWWRSSTWLLADTHWFWFKKWQCIGHITDYKKGLACSEQKSCASCIDVMKGPWGSDVVALKNVFIFLWCVRKVPATWCSLLKDRTTVRTWSAWCFLVLTWVCGPMKVPAYADGYGQWSETW